MEHTWFFSTSGHSYLVGRITNKIKLKSNHIFWMFQFLDSTVLAMGVSYLFSILF